MGWAMGRSGRTLPLGRVPQLRGQWLGPSASLPDAQTLCSWGPKLPFLLFEKKTTYESSGDVSTVRSERTPEAPAKASAPSWLHRFSPPSEAPHKPSEKLKSE